MTTVQADGIRLLFYNINNRIKENKDLLLELDSAMGDGDLGLTMTKAFAAAASTVSEQGGDNIGKLLSSAGMSIAKAAPSTMGTLMATGFMYAGKRLAGISVLTSIHLAVLLDGLTEGIMKRGKSKPGGKTIVDLFHPVADTAKMISEQYSEIEDFCGLLLENARDAYDKTTAMTAQHGRQAYYREQSAGKRDPGATVGLIIIEALYETIKELSTRA